VTHDIVQGLLLILSGTAVWLLNSKHRRRQLIGCVLGMVGQPLWLWTTWVCRQWGIFILSLVFLASYGKGAVVRWRRSRQPKIKGLLRVCGSCEYVFIRGVECPRCRWGSYSAVYVYETVWRALWAWLFQGPYRWRRRSK
jgi:hypothetical protein